jgi:23S rRNA pseudouridine1911/1915/1917 synthase
MRLDRRLRVLRPDLSWARIREAVQRGQVAVDGHVERDPGAIVGPAMAIALDPSRPALPHARLDLPRLHEDREILVVNKPAGLLTVASSALTRDVEDTVLRRAQAYVLHLRGARGYAGMLHRLDRDTSGALAIALSRDAHAAGRELFKQHRFERRYLALVAGVPSAGQGTVDAPVSSAYADGRRRLVRKGEGRRAVTHFRVREAFGAAALVELELETGRQHQIRLHLLRLGHPLLGERVYVPPTSNVSNRVPRPSRQMLHAWRLAFPHPLRETMITVEAPVPDDFEALLAALRRA